MRSLLSRLAREVKVVACPGSFPAFAIADSVGLLAWRNFPARPSHPEMRAVARAEFLPPYSRAAATVLHRLPGTESAVDVAKRCAPRLGRDTAMLRVNDLAERPKWRAPRLLGNVLAAASAQIHARPSGGTEFDVQRRVEHLLQ